MIHIILITIIRKQSIKMITDVVRVTKKLRVAWIRWHICHFSTCKVNETVEGEPDVSVRKILEPDQFTSWPPGGLCHIICLYEAAWIAATKLVKPWEPFAWGVMSASPLPGVFIFFRVQNQQSRGSWLDSHNYDNSVVTVSHVMLTT